MERGEISGGGTGSGNDAGGCRCWGRGEEKVKGVIRLGKPLAQWVISWLLASKMMMDMGEKGEAMNQVCKVFIRERVGRVWVSNREARREFNGMADDGLFGRSKKQGGRNHLLMAMGGKEASHLQILFFFF